MEHTDYHLFKAIVDAGSFANAADALGKSPSGLSRRLSRLEDRIGHRLMTRTTRRLTLTDKGEAFLTHCNKLIEDMARAEADIKAPETDLAGVLNIKVIAAYATRGFLPILEGFQTRYPRIVPWLMPEGTSDKRDVDIVISSVDIPMKHDCHILEPNPWVVCAAPTYLKTFGTPQTPAELAQHRCLVLDIAGKPQRNWQFHTGQGALNVQVPSGLIGFGDAIQSAARNSHGIARLASFLVSQDIKNGDLIPVLTEYAGEQSRAICVMPGDNTAHFAKVRAFMEYVASVTREQGERDT